MDAMIALTQNPEAWVALFTLIVMEVVLGIDNLVFISILSNKLPEHQRSKARKIGIRAAHGDAPSMKVKKGHSYRVLLRASGGLSIEPEGDASLGG